MDEEIELEEIGIKKKVRIKDLLTIDFHKDIAFENLLGEILNIDRTKRCKIIINKKESPINGGYGFIQFGTRKDINGSIKNIVLKKLLKDKPKNILVEAVLQHVSYTILKKFNLEYMIPKVYEIYRKPDDESSSNLPTASPKYILHFSMEEIKGDYIHTFIKDSHTPEKDFLICLIQISMVFYLLEKNLYLNHRDLRYSNIYIVKNPKKIQLEINDKTYKTTSNFHVCVLDFGFACVGKEESVVNAGGNFILDETKCMHTGRDLFYLIMSMWCKNDIRNRMNEAFIEDINNLFKTVNKDYIQVMDNHGEDSVWPFIMINHHNFSFPPLSPENLIVSLFDLWHKHFSS